MNVSIMKVSAKKIVTNATDKINCSLAETVKARNKAVKPKFLINLGVFCDRISLSERTKNFSARGNRTKEKALIIDA